MSAAIVAGLEVFAIGAAIIAVVVGAIALGDRFACRSWSWGSDEREAVGLAAPASRSSGSSVSGGVEASSLCDGCGQPHPPEFMPLELLIAGDVHVNPGRWFGSGSLA